MRLIENETAKSLNMNFFNKLNESDDLVIYRETSEGPLYISGPTNTSFNKEEAIKFPTEEEAREYLVDYLEEVTDYDAINFEIVCIDDIEECDTITEDIDEVPEDLSNLKDKLDSILNKYSEDYKISIRKDDSNISFLYFNIDINQLSLIGSVYTDITKSKVVSNSGPNVLNINYINCLKDIYNLTASVNECDTKIEEE